MDNVWFLPRIWPCTPSVSGYHFEWTGGAGIVQQFSWPTGLFECWVDNGVWGDHSIVCKWTDYVTKNVRVERYVHN